MKVIVQILIALVLSSCATQALVQKSSCMDVVGADELLCKKVKAVFR